MNETDLEALGALVPDPRGAGTAPRAATPGRGALDAVAAWWTSVAPGLGGPPRQVRHLWSAGEVAAEATSVWTLSSVPFDVPDDVTQALEWGRRAADAAADDGVDLVVLSLPGAATLPLGCHLLGLAPVEAIGWPGETGPSDADWIAAVAGARDALRNVREFAWPKGAEILAAIGSPALAAGTALVLAAAARSTPVLLDGPAATMSGLFARHLARRSTGWLQAATDGGGHLQASALEALRLSPLTSLGITAEDGTAGRLALSVIETAVQPRA